MNIKKIHELINLYWQGATTFEEEKAIRDFFASNNHLPSGLEKWRNWFVAKETISHLSLNQTFDDKILSYVTQPQHRTKHFRLKHILLSSAAVAVLVIFVYIALITSGKPVPTPQEITYMEELENYEAIKELLYFTSSKINQTEDILGENLSKIKVMNEYVNIK